MNWHSKLTNDLAIVFLGALGDGRFRDIGEVRVFLDDLYDTVESDWEVQQKLDAQQGPRRD